MWNVRGVGAGRVGRSSRRASCSHEDCVGKYGKDVQFLELTDLHDYFLGK